MKNPNTTTPNLSIHNNQVPKNNPTTPIYQSQYTNYPPLTNSSDPISNIKKTKNLPWTHREKTQQTKSKNSFFSSATAEPVSSRRQQHWLRQRQEQRKMRITRLRERHVLSLLARERRKMR